MIGIKIVAMVGFVVLTGCSKPAPSDPPTQQEVHSADSGVSSGNSAVTAIAATTEAGC
jgi:hypothetical protein